MAIVWANATGNWSTITLWDYWDENSQSIQPYGQTPQSDDIVYCNGYKINVGSNDITVNTLSNDVNPYTLNDGGYIMISSGSLRNINANLICGGNNLISVSFNSGGLVNINGNLTATTFSNEYVVKRSNTGNNRSNLHIQGNVNISGLGGLYNADGSNISDLGFIINGNVIVNNNVTLLTNYSSSLFGNVIINGDLKVAANVTIQLINSFTINGNYQTETPLTCNSFLIGGRIQYKSTNGNIGICCKTMSVINPNTFTWEDITEPRVNPYIIVTDYQLNNIYNYPPESSVKKDTEYAWGEKIGTYTPNYPPESVVLKDYEYGDSDDRKTGTMVQEVNVEVGCVTPEDVRKNVPLVGMDVVGTLVVPSVGDVREGVVFDNGSVGTLIVQGGGDRLRIADFGYYTRSTSITYIVDLTESDKPAFADCEEIVLRSLFPMLDLDNIPDKFFDDLFVQFLRYRLLVEYYRGISVNSKFTPSEPTTEIVNYANSKCEYWLNTANLFLQLWGEKYPNSVKKDRILL